MLILWSNSKDYEDYCRLQCNFISLVDDYQHFRRMCFFKARAGKSDTDIKWWTARK
jgi:hypothetical protein